MPTNKNPQETMLGFSPEVLEVQRKNMKTFGFAVFDNVLSPQEHAFVWTYIQNERMEFVHNGRWMRGYRLNDNRPLFGTPYLGSPYGKKKKTPCYPTNQAIDIIIEKVQSLASFCTAILGEQHQDWAYFYARAVLYPADTGHAWHRNDEHHATGAFFYYAHPDWDPQWGGENLISPLKTKDFFHKKTSLYEGGEKFVGTHLDMSQEIEPLMEEGIGTYIMPKPNRLVFLTSGVMHSIKKVDLAAGNKVVASIQGFFQDPIGIIAQK